MACCMCSTGIRVTAGLCSCVSTLYLVYSYSLRTKSHSTYTKPAEVMEISAQFSQISIFCVSLFNFHTLSGSLKWFPCLAKLKPHSPK